MTQNDAKNISTDQENYKLEDVMSESNEYLDRKVPKKMEWIMKFSNFEHSISVVYGLIKCYENKDGETFF